MSIPKQSQNNRTPPPPLGPPPLTDAPAPKVHENPHSPGAVVPPEGRTQTIVAKDGKGSPPKKP